MTERSKRIFKLKADRQSRQSYVFSKVAVLVPSQIKALRLTSSTPTQKELAAEAGTHQSRLSALEKPGAANVTLETLAWVASVHKVGLMVKFVPLSEMLNWENSYSQDTFNVTRLDADEEFLNPGIGIADISAVQVDSGEYKLDNVLMLPSPRNEGQVVVARTKTPHSYSNRYTLVGHG